MEKNNEKKMPQLKKRLSREKGNDSGAMEAVSYRARVNLFTNGAVVINPVNEGARGPIYKETLALTKHGELRKTARDYHLTFKLPLEEGCDSAATNITLEVGHFLKYFYANVNTL